MSVTGEIVRVVVLFMFVEAILILIDVNLPADMTGSVLFHLILFVLEVFIVPISALIFTVSQIQRARRSQRFHRLPLEELQRGAPASRADKPVVPRTIFGTETETWFEALFDRTFEEPSSTAAHAILTKHYATLLGGLTDHLGDDGPNHRLPTRTGRSPTRVRPTTFAP